MIVRGGSTALVMTTILGDFKGKLHTIVAQNVFH